MRREHETYNIFRSCGNYFSKAGMCISENGEINRSLAVNAGRGSYALARKAVNVIDKVRMELAEIAHGRTSRRGCTHTLCDLCVK